MKIATYFLARTCSNTYVADQNKKGLPVISLSDESEGACAVFRRSTLAYSSPEPTA
jgi:hypothetical protein